MTKFAVKNETAVPITFAIFEQPKANDNPTKNGVLKPGESKDWGADKVPLGSYRVYGVMSGDDTAHPEWNYECPGVSVVTSTLELGFKLWHEGDIDWENIKNMSSDQLEDTFGCQYTSAYSSSVSWNGFNDCIFTFKGGPVWVQETDPAVYRPRQTTMDSVTSTPMECKETKN